MKNPVGPVGFIYVVLAFCCLPATALASEKLGAGEIATIVKGKTLEMKLSRCSVPPCTMFWEWKNDDVVCARLINADRSDKCADEGRWRLDGDQLCWKLTWLFRGSTGVPLHEQCIFVYSIAEDRFEARRVQADGVASPHTFFEFAIIE